MPTLCELAGVPLPALGIQVRSLTALVAGKEAGWKDLAFAERGSAMVRTPQYKFIKNGKKNERHGGGEPELYDLTKDPLETNNLAKDPAHAMICKELACQLEAWQKDIPPVPVIEGVVPQAIGNAMVPVEKKKRKERKQKQANAP